MIIYYRAKEEKKIKVGDSVHEKIISMFDDFEKSNAKLLSFSWLQFPHAYNQVVTLSVYLYFLCNLFARQHFVLPDSTGGAGFAGNQAAANTGPKRMFTHSGITYTKDAPWSHFTPDFYFPVFAMIEVFCYFGWLKVAHALLNPYGDDDEDFDINYLIDRNLQVSIQNSVLYKGLETVGFETWG